MTDPHDAALREAAERRAERFEREGIRPGAQLRAAGLPNGGARRLSTKDVSAPSQLRASQQKRDGKSFIVVEGYYTVTDRLYDMWDWAGPYREGVRAGAGKRTTDAKPDVVYLTNHAGLALARTITDPPTLLLGYDSAGSTNEAWLNPTRPDVQMLAAGIEDGITTEQSFAFMIERGEWSPDFTEFWIEDYEIDRGDVSAVNYGANPYTSVTARSREILADLDHLPDGAARAALDLLQRRVDPNRRAMTPAEASVVSQVLGWLSAIDNIVDEGQETLAAFLNVPSPDPDEVDDMQANSTTRPAQKRADGGDVSIYEAMLAVD